MSVLSDRQSVDLHFVRLLCAGADRDRFAIKGGCNLRFFFDSMVRLIVLAVTTRPRPMALLMTRCGPSRDE